ncbi:alpha/beta hydrolase [Nocardioides cavernae]|uniref:Alpha/beta hydrolase n=1 Tax=Nocardioides cavernae TaxID=1921566 RepID=A0ABR8NGS1_9ACTN|nr:alpha/beta hydrolase [Nocardioides cavernae]MBD3925639.1 alpha/beta hydrolase [Nocardioides cavernae]MBM7513980.1 pimeloyl-ACP methyl ester carboxylesterase [Nocardioides cavernae]
MELGHVTLSDGRRVDTYVGGDPNGPAVLVQHGMPQCRLVATHLDDGAREAGVRLLALSRPGFGQSSWAEPSLASCGRDALDVATALGADTFAVLGISFGGPFAAATAAADPERVSALGICVGIGPWRILDADDPDLVAELDILALDDAGRTDEAVEAYRELMAGVFDDMLAKESDEELMVAFDAMVSPDGKRDVDWDAFPPQWRERFARDVREALTTYDGMAHDNIAAGRNWDIDLTTIHQPTFLWYGADDDLLPLKHGLWWEAQLPQAQLTVRPRTGHGGAYFIHSEDMSRTLTAAS